MTPSNPNFSSDPTDPGRVECEYDRDTPPSIAIIRAIALIENVDPMDSPTALGLTLYDHIDSGALDRLAIGAGKGSNVAIELTVHNDHQYAVQIRDNGHLVVEKAA